MWVLIAAISVLLVAFILSLASMRRKTPLMWDCADGTPTTPTTPTTLSTQTIQTIHTDPRTNNSCTSTAPESVSTILPRYYFHRRNSSSIRRRRRRYGIGGVEPQLRLASILQASMGPLPRYQRGIVALRKRQFDAGVTTRYFGPMSSHDQPSRGPVRDDNITFTALWLFADLFFPVSLFLFQISDSKFRNFGAKLQLNFDWDIS